MKHLRPYSPGKPGPFRLEGLLPTTGFAWSDRLLLDTLERLLGLSEIQSAYQGLGPSRDCDEFIAKACAALDIELRYSDAELRRIPHSGPVVVVANHPFGGIEGLLLAGLLRRFRKDVRILANSLLKRIPELSELFIGVDPFGGPRARNAPGLRQAMRWLEEGGLLLVFPAGEVSHWQASHGGITDPRWHAGVARLIQMTRAVVSPIYVYGNNSPIFQLVGLVHPWLRTALLARELLKKSRARIEIRIGQPVSYSDVSHLDAERLIQFLRLRTYLLGAITEELEIPSRQVAEIRPAESKDFVHDITALPPAQRLAASGDLAVFIAHAAQIPALLQEIGRQRELAFRAVGEGTGRDIDLDEYDADYLHLFVWDEKQKELAGGYRLGLTDHILERRGRKGLYIHTLFKIKKRLFRQMGPAIELGRSFVCGRYQRSFAPLLLLWKGIGAFVARNPRYRVLFGPVSISSDYAPASRQLIIDFLESVSIDQGGARQVRPRKKPIRNRSVWRKSDLVALGDIENISALLSHLERDGKGVPVLIRQYLKLGGKILGFNVDAQFNHAIDALIMVDLARCELRTLRRYMGEREALDYLNHHAAALGRAA